MGRIYNFDAGVLTLDFNERIRFNLELRPRVTQVYGASGTGKTLLYNCISAFKNSEDCLEDDSKVAGNIVLFSGNNLSVNDLSGLSSKLVIIDAVDDFLDWGVVSHIDSDKLNHYLVFSRLELGIHLPANHYGEFMLNNGVVIMDYFFDTKGW